MDATQGFDHIVNIIANKYANPLHSEAIAIADEAELFMSRDAERQKEEILAYRIRENDAQKAQRIRLTNPITSVAAGPIYSYFEETNRVDGVKTEIVGPAEGQIQEVENLHKLYYGNDSLSSFLHKTLLFLNKYDPNAWLVFERQMVDGKVQDLYPVIVSSEEAIDWGIDIFGQASYLVFTKEEAFIGKTNQKQEKIKHWYLYGVGYVHHMVEFSVEADYTSYINLEYELQTIGSKLYYYLQYENGTTELPAIRAGAYESEAHKRALYEPVIAPAYPVLRDLLRDKSGFDILKVLHMSPRLFQYRKPCNHVDEVSGEQCHQGFYNGVKKEEMRCQACHGNGWIDHGGDQDKIVMRFPDDPEGWIELEKLSHYEKLPTEIVPIQQEEIDKSIKRVFSAVYNQELVDKTLTVQTATEIRIEYDKIYNKLAQFDRVKSLAWEKATRVAFQYKAIPNVVAVRSVPADYKLKSTTELVAEYGAAKDAGMSYLTLWAIEEDVLNKKYRDMPAVVANIKAFEQHKPWRSKTPEEVAIILQRRALDDPQRVLYENWDTVVTEIIEERENPFYMIEQYSDQKEIIYTKVADITEQIRYNVELSPFEQDFSIEEEE